MLDYGVLYSAHQEEDARRAAEERAATLEAELERVRAELRRLQGGEH